MRTKQFMGYDRTGTEMRYVFMDSVRLKPKAYTLNDVYEHITKVLNAYTKKGQFFTTDGLTYGVKSNVESECMNTYTIIGHSAGYYIVTDFYGTECFALTAKEMYKNKEKFIGRIFTNAFLSVNMEEPTLNIMPISSGFPDMLTRCAYASEAADSRKGMKFLRNLIQVRLDTIADDRYIKHKVSKEYEVRALESNLEEVNKILKEYNDVRDLLQNYLKYMRNGKVLLEKVTMSSACYIDPKGWRREKMKKMNMESSQEKAG